MAWADFVRKGSHYLSPESMAIRRQAVIQNQPRVLIQFLQRGSTHTTRNELAWGIFCLLLDTNIEGINFWNALTFNTYIIKINNGRFKKYSDLGFEKRNIRFNDTSTQVYSILTCLYPHFIVLWFFFILVLHGNLTHCIFLYYYMKFDILQFWVNQF